MILFTLITVGRAGLSAVRSCARKVGSGRENVRQKGAGKKGGGNKGAGHGGFLSMGWDKYEAGQVRGTNMGYKQGPKFIRSGLPRNILNFHINNCIINKCN